MQNPLMQYLIGLCIFSVGLVILLSAREIAFGLSRFWQRWLGKSGRVNVATNVSDLPAPYYRARLIMWRALGALILADGLIWLALATAEVFHLLPRGRN